MQEVLFFLLALFILTIIFMYFSHLNFLSLIMYAEIVWIILYSLCILVGSYIDDSTIITLSFFLLGFAGLEFSFGFILLILFKEHNISYLLDSKYEGLSTKFSSLEV